MSRKNPEDHVLVRNAADAGQVADAVKMEKIREVKEEDAWAKVTSDPNGQKVLMDIWEYCGTFMTTWHDNPARLAANSGRQDVGHFIMAKIPTENLAAMMLKTRVKE